MVRQTQSPHAAPLRYKRNPTSAKEDKKTAENERKASPAPSSRSSWSEVTQGTKRTGGSISDEESIRSGELGDSEDSGVTKGLKKRQSKKQVGSLVAGRGSKDRMTTKVEVKDRPRKTKREKLHKGEDSLRATIEPVNDNYMRRKNKRKPLLPKADVTSTDQSSPELQLPPPSQEQQREQHNVSALFDTDLETRFPSPPMVSLDTTGRTRYMQTCKKLHVAPCSLFLRQAMNSTLNLMYYGMGPREIMALSSAFQDNTYITYLNISYNNIGVGGVLGLARCLRDNQHLSEIDMSYCFLGRETDGAKSIYYLFKCSDNVHSLNLTHNCFRSRDYVWFAELLSLPSRLFYLNLSDNDFGPSGCALFATALENNKILNGLNLDLNPLQTFGASKILHAVAKNTDLMLLKLTRVGLYDMVCDSVLSVLKKNSTLRCLDLRNNHLKPTSRRVVNINKYLENNETELELKMY